MELILVRHGLPIRREVTEGPADPELSREGLAQAKHLGDYLAIEKIDVIYTSPMKRAHQTALPLAKAKGLTPIIEPDVAEWDQHSNEYIPIEELKAANDPRWKELASGAWTSEEDPAVFRERVLGAFNRMIDNHRGERVVITCHGGVINEFLSSVLGIDRGQFFYPNYTSIHRIAASSQGHRSILSVNETSHLRGTGLPVGLFNG
ncbi:MAG: histidine phosphatase family protein [Ilumatobacteraceae bacterium]